MAKTVNKKMKIAIKDEEETLDVVHPVTDEEKILGKKEITTKERNINYESPLILYKVTNLQIKNTPITVNGSLIETFIGTGNKNIRIELKRGAKSVIIKDVNDEKLYKIEVID